MIAGLFRGWFEESPVHEGWNNIISKLTGGKIAEAEELSAETSRILEIVPQWLGPYVLVIMIIAPFIWYWYKTKKKK